MALGRREAGWKGGLVAEPAAAPLRTLHDWYMAPVSAHVRSAQFDALQRDRLPKAWMADLPGSTTPHVLVTLPSFALDRVVYDHYGDRVPPLENRYLFALLRAREPCTEVVCLSSLPVPDAGSCSRSTVSCEPVASTIAQILTA